MKRGKGLRLAIAIILCIAGFAAARINPYRETTVVIDAGGCRMVTDILDRGTDEAGGSVILLHGLAANKKIMVYLAHAFADENLRVFVPDLPGHGRTPGPFLFSRAEMCSETFVRQLIAHGLIEPSRTILAGHSMGGAISERLAARIPVASVIAVSPAPMSTRHGIARYLLPFENTPRAGANTLVISGSWEPREIRETARDVVDDAGAASNDKYVVIRHATHVSLLFSPQAAQASQSWAAQALHLPSGSGATAPSLLPLIGSLAGFVGVLLLAGPFMRETLGASAVGKAPVEDTTSESEPAAFGKPITLALLELAAASIIAVFVLHYIKPFAFVRLFNGDYFAAFLLIVGLSLLAFHHKAVVALAKPRIATLLAAAVAALLLLLLVGAWFDATLTEAWLTWFRWARFPVPLIAGFLYLAAEELVVGKISARAGHKRAAVTLIMRLVAWLALLFAIFVLHSGPILLLLLAPYFALFCILQIAAMDIVRTHTRSLLATALFGAILLAGFCLVIFPVT